MCSKESESTVSPHSHLIPIFWFNSSPYWNLASARRWTRSVRHHNNTCWCLVWQKWICTQLLGKRWLMTASRGTRSFPSAALWWGLKIRSEKGRAFILSSNAEVTRGYIIAAFSLRFCSLAFSLYIFSFPFSPLCCRSRAFLVVRGPHGWKPLPAWMWYCLSEVLTVVADLRYVDFLEADADSKN